MTKMLKRKKKRNLYGHKSQFLNTDLGSETMLTKICGNK